MVSPDVTAEDLLVLGLKWHASSEKNNHQMKCICYRKRLALFVNNVYNYCKGNMKSVTGVRGFLTALHLFQDVVSSGNYQIHIS